MPGNGSTLATRPTRIPPPILRVINISEIANQNLGGVAETLLIPPLAKVMGIFHYHFGKTAA
jgi:hypothetical protein